MDQHVRYLAVTRLHTPLYRLLCELAAGVSKPHFWFAAGFLLGSDNRGRQRETAGWRREKELSSLQSTPCSIAQASLLQASSSTCPYSSSPIQFAVCSNLQPNCTSLWKHQPCLPVGSSKIWVQDPLATPPLDYSSTESSSKHQCFQSCCFLPVLPLG